MWPQADARQHWCDSHHHGEYFENDNLGELEQMDEDELGRDFSTLGIRVG